MDRSTGVPGGRQRGWRRRTRVQRGFTLNPVDAEPPAVAAVDETTAVSLDVTTRGNPRGWLDQHRLIARRRTDLVAPLTSSVDSPAVKRWRDSRGYDLSGYTAYSQ